MRQLSLYLDEENLVEELNKIAKLDKRSMSSLIQVVLRDFVLKFKEEESKKSQLKQLLLFKEVSVCKSNRLFRTHSVVGSFPTKCFSQNVNEIRQCLHC